MNMKTSLSLATLVAFGGLASAQGLLSIAPETTTPFSLPVSFSVSADAGYDTNINNSGFDEVDSFYISGGAGVDWAYATDRTVATVGVSGSVFHYFDQVPEIDDTLYNVRAGISLAHALTDRLSLNNKFYFGYEFEPNYVFGVSLNRRNDQYYFAYNTLTLDYLWTERLSTSTGYTIQGIFYDNDGISQAEDRIRHQFNQLVRYALNENTGLRAEYRYAMVDYDNSSLDSTSHYALVGIDHAFSENTNAVVMAGAQFFDFDARGSRTKPFVEAGLNHQVDEALSLRWANRLSFEDSQVQSSGDNYSYRTSLDARYQYTEKLATYAGLVYIHQDLTRGPASGTENIFQGTIGTSYALTEALALRASYTYNLNDSFREANDFDRHRVNVGVTASF